MGKPPCKWLGFNARAINTHELQRHGKTFQILYPTFHTCFVEIVSETVVYIAEMIVIFARLRRLRSHFRFKLWNISILLRRVYHIKKTNGKTLFHIYSTNS
jgi:hypothetical protein